MTNFPTKRRGANLLHTPLHLDLPWDWYLCISRYSVCFIPGNLSYDMIITSAPELVKSFHISIDLSLLIRLFYLFK